MFYNRPSVVVSRVATVLFAAWIGTFHSDTSLAQVATAGHGTKTQQELQQILGATEKGAEGALPSLTMGTPDYIQRAAEQYARSKGSVRQGEDAVNFVLDELRQKAVQSGLSQNLAEAKQQLSSEAIILIDQLQRPALKVCNDTITDAVPPNWAPKFESQKVLVSRAMQSVGLISFANIPNAGPVGTGFLVAKNIVMTNRHVAMEFARPDGTFKAHPQTQHPALVTIDFVADYCNDDPKVRRISKVLHIEPDPGPDVALLQVEGNDLPAPLSLQRNPLSSSLEGTSVYAVGYPFEDGRNPAEAQKLIFGLVYGVKRLSPGELMKDSGISIDNSEPYLFHDCSTLGGSSGSPLIGLDGGKVVGIHFQGVYASKNWAWPMWRVLQVEKIRNIIDGGGAEANQPSPPTRSPAGASANPLPRPSANDAGLRESKAPPSEAQQPGLRTQEGNPPASSGHNSDRRIMAQNKELRVLLGDHEHTDGNEGGLPQLESGIPEPVRLLATEQIFRATGQYVSNDDSVKRLFDEGGLIAPSRKPIPVGEGPYNTALSPQLELSPFRFRGPDNHLLQVSEETRNEFSRPFPLDAPSRHPFSSQGTSMQAVAAQTRAELSLADFTKFLTRPALFVCNDTIDDKVPATWIDDMQRHQAAIVRTNRSTGLITCENDIPGAMPGTGFVVAKNLLVTNRHIAESFAESNGQGGWRFKTERRNQAKPALVFVNFHQYHCQIDPLKYAVTSVVHIEPEPGPDIALLEVKSLDNNKHPALRLARVPLKDSEMKDRKVYIAGYPFDDPAVPEEVVQKLFFGITGVKRLQPGTLKESHPIDRLVHDCSTLTGNSGSSVTDIQTGAVIGIHYYGDPAPPYYNQAVPAWKLWEIPAFASRIAAVESPGELPPLAQVDTP